MKPSAGPDIRSRASFLTEADLDEKLTRWHVYFSGEVQAVGFRYTAMLYARDLGLTGWVKNLYDGRVEMEAQGSVSLLRKLLLYLKSHPPIRITDYHIQEIPLLENETRFIITG